MRKLIVPLILIIGWVGCQKDPCKDINCQNGGICFEGSCLCPDGFNGPNCETSTIADFAGTYLVSETCNAGNFAYTIEIALDTAAQQNIFISNMADLGSVVTAIAQGDNFSIAPQLILNDTISGTGMLTDSILTINYVLVPDSGQTLTCTLTGTLQP